MENRKRYPTIDSSERKVEQLQRKALAEQEKRKKPGECLKVCIETLSLIFNDEAILTLFSSTFAQ